MHPLSYMLGLKSYNNGAWYDPSYPNRVDWMIDLLKIQIGDRSIDIGSGDGRVVIAMAKAGARAVGIEKDNKLVKLSREYINQQHLSESAQIISENMFDHCYRRYNKVALYQLKTVMLKLEKKLLEELPKGALIASNYWKFPNWKITKKINDVYLYKK